MADVDGDGTLEVATASIGSPPYLLRADGTSFYGDGPAKKPITMASLQSEFKSAATDGPSIASLGGGAIGRLGGDGSPLAFAMGSTGLRRLLDVVLPDQQLGAEDHIGAWDMATGTYEPGFPALMNDLMFFNTPAIADVDGDGRAEVLQGSAMYDLRAYGLGGTVPATWPKFTGGWSVSTPAVGEFAGGQAVATVTREGNLFVWRSGGAPCAAPEWPKYQHDLHNSGSYGTDATPPSAVSGASAQRVGLATVLTFAAAGDDGACGQAAAYVVSFAGRRVRVPATAVTGGLQRVTVPSTGAITIQAVDDAGNLSFPLPVAPTGVR
jgi:hypothetical protein